MNLNSRIEIPLGPLNNFRNRIKMFFLASLVNILLIPAIFLALSPLAMSMGIVFLAFSVAILYLFIVVLSSVYIFFLFRGYKKDNLLEIPKKIENISLLLGFLAGIFSIIYTTVPFVTNYIGYFEKEFGEFSTYIIFFMGIAGITLFSFVGIKIGELLYYFKNKTPIQSKSIITLIILLIITLVPFLSLFLKVQIIKQNEEEIANKIEVKNVQEIGPVLIKGPSDLLPRIQNPHTRFVIKANMYFPKNSEYEVSANLAWFGIFFMGGAPSLDGYGRYFEQGWHPVEFVLEWEDCQDMPKNTEKDQTLPQSLKADFTLIPENRKIYTLVYGLKPRSKNEFFLHCYPTYENFPQ